MRTFRPLAILVCWLALPCYSNSPQAAEEKKAEERPLKLPFPEVKGWRLSEPRQLPPESGGYSVAYDADLEERVAVTVYVYTRGLAKISDDFMASEHQQEIRRAKEAIFEAQKMGVYEAAQEIESSVSTLGLRPNGRKSLYARFALQADQQKLRSEVYVLPYKNHFIKVRLTRAEASPQVVQNRLDALFDSLNQLLRVDE